MSPVKSWRWKYRFMVSLSLTLVPLITGDIHVMANPTLQTTKQFVENAQRISEICTRLQPSFDESRLCVKVVATWEGLQACRELTSLGIRTLATTLFTIEQAILAAEAECVYIAPFVHELKAFFDETYHDGEPILPLCVQAQRYFEQHSYVTRVKAAGLLSVDEAVKLAGVASLTIAPNLLHTLSKSEELESQLADRSLFQEKAMLEGQAVEHTTFIDDEAKFREAFAKSAGGKGQIKTAQAIEIFSEYQIKAESMMRDPDLTRIG
ncbi:hypothetical protein OEA41_005894 [Lepraria neglecta]|uniref:Transaldolase n=1 Tax=Lepraria neglecta TaxID=209136 RepID=A0AAE0DKH1_9LECA|nr:hypothetical protein OEA41_005894 [Lepraria neglecta]